MSKTSEIINKPKEIPTTTSKHMRNKAKAKKVTTENADTQNCPTFKENMKSPVKSKSKKTEKVKVNKELLQNTHTLNITSPKVLSTEEMKADPLKTKSKWLAKREQEILKQAEQIRIKLNLVSQQERNYNAIFKNPVKDTALLQKEFSKGQKQITETHLTFQPTTNRINCIASYPSQSVLWSAGCQDEQKMLVCKENVIVSEQIQNSSKHLSKKYSLGLRGKEQGVTVVQTKTCVWDHIKHGFNRRRYFYVPGMFPIVSTHKVNTSESVLKPHTGNDQNTMIKPSPVQFPLLQTLVQKPVFDMLSSRLQNMPVLPYSPEMATGYGGTFSFSSHSGISNKNVLLKCQTSKPLPQRQGRVSPVEKFTLLIL